MLAIDVVIVSGRYSDRSNVDASIINGGETDTFSYIHKSNGKCNIAVKKLLILFLVLYTMNIVSWNLLTSLGEHKDVVSTESKESDVEEDEETLRRNILFDIVSSMDTRKGCFFGL